MKVFAVLSRKGGCGKTLVSHLLSYGFGSLNKPTILVQTDVRSSTPPHDVRGRPYLAYGIDSRDAAPEEKFVDIYEKCERFGDCMMVIDGGANRRSVDLVATQIADMVIVPCGFSTEDTEVAMRDLEEFKADLATQGRPEVPVALLLNRWPGDKRRLKTINSRPWISDFLDKTAHTRLDAWVPDITSAMDMTFNGSPNAPMAVRVHGVKLAETVCDLLGVEYAQAGAPENEATPKAA